MDLPGGETNNVLTGLVANYVLPPGNDDADRRPGPPPSTAPDLSRSLAFQSHSMSEDAFDDPIPPRPIPALSVPLVGTPEAKIAIPTERSPTSVASVPSSRSEPTPNTMLSAAEPAVYGDGDRAYRRYVAEKRAATLAANAARVAAEAEKAIAAASEAAANAARAEAVGEAREAIAAAKAAAANGTPERRSGARFAPANSRNDDDDNEPRRAAEGFPSSSDGEWNSPSPPLAIVVAASDVGKSLPFASSNREHVPKELRNVDPLFVAQFDSAVLAFLDSNPSYSSRDSTELTHFRASNLLKMVKEKTDSERELANQLVKLEEDKTAMEQEFMGMLRKMNEAKAKRKSELELQVRNCHAEIARVEKDALRASFLSTMERVKWEMELREEFEQKARKMEGDALSSLGVDDEELKRQKSAERQRRKEKEVRRKVRKGKLAVGVDTPLHEAKTKVKGSSATTNFGDDCMRKSISFESSEWGCPPLFAEFSYDEDDHNSLTEGGSNSPSLLPPTPPRNHNSTSVGGKGWKIARDKRHASKLESEVRECQFLNSAMSAEVEHLKRQLKMKEQEGKERKKVEELLHSFEVRDNVARFMTESKEEDDKGGWE